MLPLLTAIFLLAAQALLLLGVVWALSDPPALALTRGLVWGLCGLTFSALVSTVVLWVTR